MTICGPSPFLLQLLLLLLMNELHAFDPHLQRRPALRPFHPAVHPAVVSFSSSNDGTESSSSSSSSSAAAPLRKRPHVDLTAEDVVNIQLMALQRNDVYRAFKFASPNNKRATGPWQRFRDMIAKNPQYRQLLFCSSFEIVGAVPLGDTRRQVLVRVRPAGSSTAPYAVASPFVGFMWELSKQVPTESSSSSSSSSPFDGCWMVDSVMPVSIKPA